jgi:hypothetical protein
MRQSLARFRGSVSSIHAASSVDRITTMVGLRFRYTQALYRNLAEQADDPVVNHELLALAFVCDEVADNIEDHLTGGEAPLGPSSRPSESLAR